MTPTTVGEVAETLPDEYPVSIVMERRRSRSRWSEESWEAVGIATGQPEAGGGAGEPVLIHEDSESSRYLLAGYRLRLHRDECESYYHNLMTPHPRCYVIARQEDDGAPEPFLVSMSFDEAHAYLEAGDPIYAVDIPPELYKWCEAFVLAHYVPQRKYKRKLDSWKDGGVRR